MHAKGPQHYMWKGGRYFSHGYVMVQTPGHSHAQPNGYAPEHLVIATKALGHALPKDAQVHHYDENKGNNSDDNLVICENSAYHLLLHVRARAFRACGNPDYHKCHFCKHWGPASEVINYPNTNEWFHPSCRKDYLHRKYVERTEGLVKRNRTSLGRK